MRRVIDFVFAARPMLLIPVWSIYLISFKTINSSANFSLGEFAVLAGVTLMVAGTYYINQIYDLESDKANGKLGFLEQGLITRSQTMAAYMAVSCLGLLVALLSDLHTFLLFLLIFLLGFIYSAPPLRLKDRPFWGLAANAAGYGIVLPLLVKETGPYSTTLKVLLMSYFVLVVLSEYLLTIIPDRPGDREGNKKTLALMMGDQWLIGIGTFFLAISIFPALLLQNFYLLVTSLISMILYLLTLIGRASSIIMFACKMPILLLALLAGYYYPVYLVFVIFVIIGTRIYYRKRFQIVYPRFN